MTEAVLKVALMAEVVTAAALMAVGQLAEAVTAAGWMQVVLIAEVVMAAGWMAAGRMAVGETQGKRRSILLGWAV